MTVPTKYPRMACSRKRAESVIRIARISTARAGKLRLPHLVYLPLVAGLGSRPSEEF
jgi:hypothetical protein